MKYYVGLDGGGTRTCAVVADEYQNIVYRTYGKTINYCGVDFISVQENMRELFNDIKRHLNIESFERVVIGSSSNYDNEDNDILRELNKVIPSSDITYYGDADVALNSIDEDTAAVIIAGTGSMLLAKVGDNQYTVGGYGHILGDEGSAYDIAINGLKQAIRYSDGWAEPTELLRAAMDYFEISESEDIINRIYIGDQEKSYVAGFSKTVSDVALSGDKAANDILLQAADSLFRQFCALNKKVDNKLNTVYLYGSVLIKAEVVRQEFKQKMKETFPQISVNSLARPPEVGALRFCFDIFKNDLL